MLRLTVVVLNDSLVQQQLNVAYETSIFWSMFMLHRYWKKNPNSYPAETD